MVHLGIVFIGVAIVGNEFYQQTTNATLAQGETVQLAGFELKYEGLQNEEVANRIETSALIGVYNLDSGRQVGTLFPKRNFYPKTPDMPTSEVGLRMTPIQDVYVVLNGWEVDGSTATVTIFVNPLTMWLWIGGVILVLGTLICTWPHPSRKRSEVAQAVAYATGD
jgi:cytochrome c-type biogenesis protein CcmF